MVKFSIITVCLNSSKTIRRCLESVSNQTFRDFEHIIIDGKSNDLTLSILAEYQINKVISERDNGIYFAMNKGISLADGEFIVFLNSDDAFHSTYLEVVNRYCDKFDFVNVGVNLIYPKKQLKWLTDSNILKQQKFWSMPLPHPGLMIKRTIIEKIGGFDTKFRLAADYNFILKLLRITRKGFICKQVLVDFWAGGQSHKFSIVYENYLVRKSNYGLSISLFIYLMRDLIRHLRGILLG